MQIEEMHFVFLICPFNQRENAFETLVCIWHVDMLLQQV